MGGFFWRLRRSLGRFMTGRYGTDKLNMVILITGFAISLGARFVPFWQATLAMTILSYGLLIWAMFRMLSRNTYKRYQENRKFRSFWQRLRDREHKYYRCPKCRQQVRVPKGKGKISINCPKCREKFVKKT